MGCCNNKSLKRVTDINNAIVVATKAGMLLVLHKDDIAGFSSDSDNVSISLKLGYTKDFNRGELLDFDDVILQLTNLRESI